MFGLDGGLKLLVLDNNRSRHLTESERTLAGTHGFERLMHCLDQQVIDVLVGTPACVSPEAGVDAVKEVFTCFRNSTEARVFINDLRDRNLVILKTDVMICADKSDPVRQWWWERPNRVA